MARLGVYSAPAYIGLMKHYLLAALLAAAAPALAQTTPPPAEQEAGSIEALDAKNGFRQYKLGAPIADYPNLKSKGKLGYIAPNESMNVGEFKISSLSFSAYEGRVSSIMFMASGLKDTHGIISALKAQYGEGEDTGNNMQAWKGKKATMYCQAGGTTLYPVCVVILMSNELSDLQKAQGDKAANKAAGDL